MFETILAIIPTRGRARPLAISRDDPETIITNAMETLVKTIDLPEARSYALGVSSALISMVTCGCQWKSIKFMLEAANSRLEEEIVYEH